MAETIFVKKPFMFVLFFAMAEFTGVWLRLFLFSSRVAETILGDERICWGGVFLFVSGPAPLG